MVYCFDEMKLPFSLNFYCLKWCLYLLDTMANYDKIQLKSGKFVVLLCCGIKYQAVSSSRSRFFTSCLSLALWGMFSWFHSSRSSLHSEEIRTLIDFRIVAYCRGKAKLDYVVLSFYDADWLFIRVEWRWRYWKQHPAVRLKLHPFVPDNMVTVVKYI